MPDAQFLTPYGFAELDEVRAYLKREGAATPELTIPRIVDSANQAVAWMESDEGAGRALAARTYRTAASIASCVLTADSTAVTGAGFTAGAKALDDVLNASLAPGTRVASVTSDSALVLSKPALAANGAATLVFGSAPMLADGHGGYEVHLPEYPVAEVYGVKWIDDTTGDLTALDTTAYRFLDPDRRLLRLPNDAMPKGQQNVQVECLAGYRQPSATSLGDWAHWNALRRIQLRAALVIFQDWSRNAGRIVSEQLAQQGVNIGSWSMPEDIVRSIKAYRRLW